MTAEKPVPVELDELTQSQARAVARIREEADDRVHQGGEVEEFTITRWPGSRRVMVWVKVRPTPEGTIGALFPTYGHFVVGPRGGLRALGVRKGRKTDAKRHPLIFGWNR